MASPIPSVPPVSAPIQSVPTAPSVSPKSLPIPSVKAPNIKTSEVPKVKKKRTLPTYQSGKQGITANLKKPAFTSTIVASVGSLVKKITLPTIPSAPTGSLN